MEVERLQTSHEVLPWLHADRQIANERFLFHAEEERYSLPLAWKFPKPIKLQLTQNERHESH